MANSEKFWEKAYKENAGKIKGICYRYISNKEIAEDLTHEVFLTAIYKYNTFKGLGSFEAWLRKIAINSSLMYLRKIKTQNNTILLVNENEYKLFDDTDNENNIRNTIEKAGFSNEDMLNVINELPEHHKLVFNLYVIDNYSHSQIGKKLNISSGTSKSHLARARKKIQLLLYQKALDKLNNKKEMKRAGIFLLFVPRKKNYIDKLFKNKLLNYTIKPVNVSNSVFNSVKWNAVKKPFFNSLTNIAKPKHWLVGTSCGIITLGAFIISRNSLPEISVNPEKDKSQVDCTYFHVKPDTSLSIKETPTKSDSLNRKKEPVVIRKNIIQQKTIIVRDTIKK